MSETTGCITWHYIVLKPCKPIYSYYYKWLFKSEAYIKALQRTCNFIRDGQDLRYSNFVQVPLFQPSLTEQKEIAEYLNMMDIIQKFISLQGDKLIFPRFHQLDVVRKLITDVKVNGAGRNYLIQHSAGSGKSNSIAWTAYRLASLHDQNNKAIFSSRSINNKTILM